LKPSWRIAAKIDEASIKCSIAEVEELERLINDDEDEGDNEVNEIELEDKNKEDE
jgi:hypothetical protein